MTVHNTAGSAKLQDDHADDGQHLLNDWLLSRSGSLLFDVHLMILKWYRTSKPHCNVKQQGVYLPGQSPPYL